MSKLSASDLHSPASTSARGQVLKGQYVAPFRSQKGKLKGLILKHAGGEQAVKLPKYLRPMLVTELKPGCFLEVVAYLDENIWQAIDLRPWAADPNYETLAPPGNQTSSTAACAELSPRPTASKLCIQVCRKGKCFKQGGQQIWSVLQAEVDQDPNLGHITIEATGCMSACKHGPNLRLKPKGKMLNRATPERALALLAEVR
ncbi:MAG: (2Fe-2S) ferredoxin domain-containing protein [Nodosilinea sp.]